ncbi:hypothetical protein [Candidatus Ichthyocystis hellenicum]|uniref:hypothetical protein n=1 Tax=Candidatus Ichthyocystis hellenicum TaxID=1561003 RepID=UPI000B88B15B|nr:hypothetical protein [Candidatus Ichthyocystis hellenicum]
MIELESEEVLRIARKEVVKEKRAERVNESEKRAAGMLVELQDKKERKKKREERSRVILRW